MHERITKYLQGKLSESERLDLLRLISVDEKIKQEFIHQQHLNALTHLSPHVQDVEDGAKSYRLFIKELERKKQHKSFFMQTKYAAAIVLLITASVFSTLLVTKKSLDTVVMNKIYAPAGQRVQLTLQDGTEVWLNSNTTLTYPSHFTDDERRISVLGEAFFDVAKNDKKPFIISSQNVQIKVLGTRFNLNSYSENNYIRTSLLEGSVEMFLQKDQSQSVVLEPNQQVTLKDGNMQIEQIKNDACFTWTDGLYAFEDEQLIDILKRLEIYYDVTIILQNPDDFRVNYTGKFRQRDGIEDILNVIQYMHHFKIERDRKNNIITLK